MPKRFFAAALAAVMIFCMAACGKPKQPAGPALKEGVTLQSVADEIAAEYPLTMPAPLSEEMITDVLEIKMEDVEEYAGYLTMVMVSADHFLAIKAKEGKVEAVQKGMEDRLAYMRSVFENYVPAARFRTEAGKVVTVGDYVFLIILGREGNTDYAADVAAVEEMINSYFMLIRN